MRAAAVIVALAACGPSGEPLQIHYTYAIGSEQACLAEDGDPVKDCTEIPMTCDSVALLRVVDADDPTHVYVEQCGFIPNTRPQHDLCPISQVFTNDGRFPTTRVAVQIAVYNRDDIELNEDNEPMCPANIVFTASGFAAPSNQKQPALAGMAYTDGFDSEVVVELGCNDTGLIDTEECRNEDSRDVTAEVFDFDNLIQVGTDEAELITVRVGEPTPAGQNWVFGQSTVDLPLDEAANPPRWTAANVDANLIDYACVQVDDGGDPRSTPSISCIPLVVPVPQDLALAGFRVDEATLDEILDALALPEFPNNGLVIGRVMLEGNGVAGANVSDSAGSVITYLSADRTSVGGTSTSSNGIFIATMAPFETGGGAANHWTATAPMASQLNDPVGGQINFKLMVVIIEMTAAF